MKWSNNCNAMFNDGCYFCFGYVWLDWGVGGLMGGGGSVFSCLECLMGVWFD